MKILFRLMNIKHDISANRINFEGRRPTIQPNRFTLEFLSEENDVEISMTLDERHRLAVVLAEQNVNGCFEFDFSQPLPPNRLNEPLKKNTNGKV